MKKTIEQLIRPEIRALSAYHVAPSEGMLKLDSMENPYPLPQSLREKLGATLANTAINRYPDAASSRTKALLRAAMGIAPDMEILIGNGSDEIIQIVALTLSRPGAALLTVEPSFVVYKMVAAFCGFEYVGVPLNADFSLDLQATLAAIEHHQPALTFIAYPNNPTGNLFAVSEVEAIIDAAPGLVVVDEAYFPFNDATFVHRIGEYPNLVVMRTVSKLGLAGIRLGFLVGARQWLDEFDKVRLPYNINVMTQRVAELLLEDLTPLREQTAAIRAERPRLMEKLAALPGVATFASDTNFVLLRLKGANAVFEALKQRGILVKNLAASHPLLADTLRVTVGTSEENQRFLSALGECLSHR